MESWHSGNAVAQVAALNHTTSRRQTGKRIVVALVRFMQAHTKGILPAPKNGNFMQHAQYVGNVGKLTKIWMIPQHPNTVIQTVLDLHKIRVNGRIDPTFLEPTAIEQICVRKRGSSD